MVDERSTQQESRPRELEAGPEPLGDALTTRMWLARIALIVCVVMTVVVFVLGSHPFWHVAFPAGALWALIAAGSASRRKTIWQDLMERRRAVLGRQQHQP